MSSSDKDSYRLVPYRFVINESKTDICKLEKLTNLFPEMKAIIELELFKMNNFQHLIDRLSTIYTASTKIDTRDDTFHLFLGPYHLSLGPAIYGALQLRNISTALLASSHSKNSNENTTQSKKRRHEAILRRFRRSVRKLILIKSIIDQLRLASILTPYNQYELYTNGIYDLVLAGHIHNSGSSFDDDEFGERIKNFRSMNKFEKDNSLAASQFIKINTLLHLLSPTPHQQQQQSDNTSTTQTNRSDNTTNENSSKSIIDSSDICCSQHAQNIPLIKFPLNRSVSQQSTQFLPSEPRSRRTSRHYSRRNSAVPPEQITTHSLPDLTASGHDDTHIPSNLEKSTSSRLNINQEDAFVNRISTLVTNYLLSQQSTEIHSHADHNHEKLEDSTESLSSITNAITSDDSDAGEFNEFDKLLQRIKTIVDKNLTHNSTKTTTISSSSNDLRHQLLISRAETAKDQLNRERRNLPINRRKLLQSSKSQSFDEANLKLFSETYEPDDSIDL